MTDEGTENLKEKVSLDWMKDKEKMTNLTEKQAEILADLYVKSLGETEHHCLNCYRRKKVREMFSMEKDGRGYYCSYACAKGYNIRKRMGQK